MRQLVDVVQSNQGEDDTGAGWGGAGGGDTGSWGDCNGPLHCIQFLAAQEHLMKVI